MTSAPHGLVIPGPHHIETSTGNFLDLVNPDPASFSTDDVAHALANTCRFGGHCRRFYSVAEHAVLVAAKLRADGAGPELQLVGLHHDDAEAFLGDIPRPLKPLLREFAVLEERMDEVIAAAFGLLDLPRHDPAIKRADDWALSAEARHLLPSRGEAWFSAGLFQDGVDYGVEWDGPLGLEPAHAWALFLERDAMLRAEIPAWLDRAVVRNPPAASAAAVGLRDRTAASGGAA